MQLESHTSYQCNMSPKALMDKTGQYNKSLKPTVTVTPFAEWQSPRQATAAQLHR